MKTHASTETTLLVGVTALALVLCTMMGPLRVSASDSSASRSDPNLGSTEFLKAFMSLSGERKQPRIVEGQFSEPSECWNAVMRDLLQATDEQWQQIEPRLNELEAVRQRTLSAVGVWVASASSHSASSGGGSSGPPENQQGRPNDPGRTGRGSYSARARSGHAGSAGSGAPPRQQPQSTSGRPRPSARGKSGPLTEGMQLCRGLLDLIESRTARDEQVREKMAQLTAYRQQAKKEIQTARETLRQVVTRRQEAMLILMGYLD